MDFSPDNARQLPSERSPLAGETRVHEFAPCARRDANDEEAKPWQVLKKVRALHLPLSGSDLNSGINHRRLVAGVGRGVNPGKGIHE